MRPRRRFEQARPQQDTTRINESIRVPRVRLVDSDGSQVGIKPTAEALEYAYSKDLDLVEVAASADPPVARIMDYGKYKYEQKKKAAAGKAKGKGRTAVMKEVKMRPSTDEHDLQFKMKNARRFLLDGDKVKVTVMFRGREMAHRKSGYDKLDHVKKLLGTLVTVEAPPQMNGRFLSMVLVPNREAVEAARRAEEAAAREAGAQAPPQGESEAHA